MIRFIKRAWLLFQIRSLETTIYGRQEIMPLIDDRIQQARLSNMQDLALNDLWRLKRMYRRVV
jgi:hypothetical protein